MKSRVHPKYKTKYRVRNWASYERALIGRGNITIWLSRAAIAAWKPEGTRTRGAPPTYSDLAIETALTLRLLFHLPLRQAEGFLTSLFHLMGLDLRSPDLTTLSRRGQHLNLTLRRVPRRAALHLFIDSTGRSMVGEGEWAAAKHGRRGRRGWKKLHLGVDHAGVIVAQALTDSAMDDASTGIDLIETIASSARMVTADAAYDTLAFYETANTRGTTVVVPPAKTAKLSRRNPRSSARDGTIRRISKIGRRRWKKEVGYHRQARVENAFFRYKSMLGDRLRRRTRAAQAVESVRACNVLNRMTELQASAQLHCRLPKLRDDLFRAIPLSGHLASCCSARMLTLGLVRFQGARSPEGERRRPPVKRAPLSFTAPENRNRSRDRARLRGCSATTLPGRVQNLTFAQGGIRITERNATAYDTWACWCRDIATVVNEAPVSPCRGVRAVDVERALFTLADSQATDKARVLLDGPAGWTFDRR